MLPHPLLTSVQALERLISEEAQPRIGDDPQHGGYEAMIEGLQPLFPGDADEDMKDVAVPARTEGTCGWAANSAEGGAAGLNSLILPYSFAVGVGRVWMLIPSLRNITTL